MKGLTVKGKPVTHHIGCQVQQPAIFKKQHTMKKRTHRQHFVFTCKGRDGTLSLKVIILPNGYIQWELVGVIVQNVSEQVQSHRKHPGFNRYKANHSQGKPIYNTKQFLMITYSISILNLQHSSNIGQVWLWLSLFEEVLVLLTRHLQPVTC